MQSMGDGNIPQRTGNWVKKEGRKIWGGFTRDNRKLQKSGKIQKTLFINQNY